mmetsp:Transcript_5561/g.8623  ORF Transcript_5561/g.8623 Transcript_5561/m.8623 type:complete len:356 (+) Transcript_5561:91-1158(+)
MRFIVCCAAAPFGRASFFQFQSASQRTRESNAGYKLIQRRSSVTFTTVMGLLSFKQKPKRENTLRLPGARHSDGTRKDGFPVDTKLAESLRGLTLSAIGVKVLESACPSDKVAITFAAKRLWDDGDISVIGTTTAPDRPARPEKPALVPHTDVPSQRAGVVPANVHSLHMLTHVELNAIDLAWDSIVQFSDRGLPTEFAVDFLDVANDEAHHFSWLSSRLQTLGYYYGVMAAHDQLWDCAIRTKNDLSARMAIVPLVQEARGLDAGPRFVARLIGLGDLESAQIVHQISVEEELHVRVGMKWFLFECRRLGINPLDHFHHCVRTYDSPINPPFNSEARSKAGLTEDWYLPVAKVV